MDLNHWWKCWRRALIATWFFRLIPGVRMVGLNGSLATGFATPKSDIDFLIVTSPGKIFRVRALSLLCTQLLGLRRKNKRVAGKICMNWYVTSDGVEITPHNLYCAQTYHNLIPLLDDGYAYKKFTKANMWMKAFGYPPANHKPVFQLTEVALLIQKLLEVIFSDRFERWVEKRQLARFQADERRLIPGSMVGVTPSELRFHLRKDS